MFHRTRPGIPWQVGKPHRSSEAFDAIPLSVQQRTDIVGNAKRLYGALSSAQRMDWAPTYAELAERLGSSQRSIIRWVQQLAEAGLIAVRRRGQGFSNILTVIGLAVRGDRPATPHVTDWPAPSSRSGASKNSERKIRVYGTPGRLSDPRWLGRWT